MLFAIFGHDRNGALARRLEVRPQHLARIDQLVEEKRILIAGPLPKATDGSSDEEGFHGSLIIGEFDSIEDAREWAEGDPYFTEGVFEKVDVFPFRQVRP